MKREYSHRYTNALRTAARASNYFEEFKRGHREVFIYCRESHESQRDNLKGQIENVWWGVEILGANVRDVFSEVARGYDYSRPQLLRAIALSRKHRIIVVAESTERFIRSPRFRVDRTALPTVYDFWQFLNETDAEGVSLVTLWHPDLDWKEVRKLQSRRGQIETGNYGGRPTTKRPGYKKQRKLERKGKVLEMLGAGASVRQTSRETGIPASTIQLWKSEKTVHS